MKSKIITIKKGQRLSDILDAIPTNTILFKNLTGIGATHLELNTKRNSIIIEPNVPVILGKRKKGILGVCEGVTRQDVVVYLSNDQFQYKKILVTPESYQKVADAMDILGIDMLYDYFLMYDECDRTAKDVDFRASITKPMDDFFRFRNKAFVSATALMPSDPRFEEQGFQVIRVEPEYDNRKDIQLVKSNNVMETFRKRIIGHNDPDTVYCIFLNSTIGIMHYVIDNNIAAESAVFASENAINDISKIKNIGYCSDKLNVSKFRKYNFFTSRYFAAVDIELGYKPHVVIITDFRAAEHTMIDPQTDAIQIVGRFRQGVSAISIFTNGSPELTAMTKEESISYLYGCEESYNSIKGLLAGATNPGAQDTLSEALKLVPFANFIYDDGSINHFMRDNFIHKERLKSYYVDQSKLISAYKMEQERVQHFRVTEITDLHPVSDSVRKRFDNLPNYQDKVKECIKTLDWFYTPITDGFVIDNRNTVFDYINRLHPEIVEAYNLLGRDQLEKIAHSKKDVQQAIDIEKRKNAKSDFQLIHELHDKYADGEWVVQSVMLREFEQLIVKNGLTMEATIPNFENFFEVGPRTTNRERFGSDVKVRKIIRAKHTRS